MFLKEFKERIDKLIEKQYNGYITFEYCIKECNKVIDEYKNFVFGCNIFDAENCDAEKENLKRINKLRMYMLNKLMGLLINEYE